MDYLTSNTLTKCFIKHLLIDINPYKYKFKIFSIQCMIINTRHIILQMHETVVILVIGYQHKTVKVSCISYVEILYNYEEYSVENRTQNVTVIVIYDFIIYSRNTRLAIYSNYDILTKKRYNWFGHIQKL